MMRLESSELSIRILFGSTTCFSSSWLVVKLLLRRDMGGVCTVAKFNDFMCLGERERVGREENEHTEHIQINSHKSDIGTD